MGWGIVFRGGVGIFRVRGGGWVFGGEEGVVWKWGGGGDERGDDVRGDEGDGESGGGLVGVGVVLWWDGRVGWWVVGVRLRKLRKRVLRGGVFGGSRLGLFEGIVVGGGRLGGFGWVWR